MVNKTRCIGYDAEWQFPAITEEHAYRKALASLAVGKEFVYFGFPWATLIDVLKTKGPKAAAPLAGRIEGFADTLKRYSNVVTVCQHIKMLEFLELFQKAGVNHIFWSHAVKNVVLPPGREGITIYPFPLYPVQATDVETPPAIERKYLYSFVGAKSNQWYLTQSRNMILESLAGDGRGLVIKRDQWHYNRIVYDHQIHKHVDNKQELVDKSASEEFKELLRQSVFSLCPSGTGPNSMRLWESIGYNAIPVILADSYLPPGDLALWDAAVVYCSETSAAIKALPDKLEMMAKDNALLERKRHALKQLWMIYGPECFIYDIQKLFLEMAGREMEVAEGKASFSFARLLEVAKVIEHEQSPRPDRLGAFILGCSSRATADAAAFVGHYRSNASLRNAFRFAMTYGKAEHRETMAAVIKIKKLELD